MPKDMGFLATRLVKLNKLFCSLVQFKRIKLRRQLLKLQSFYQPFMDSYVTYEFNKENAIL
jgi:hypothetical protein